MMKINLKSLFCFKKKPKEEPSGKIDYDQHVDFYYSCLINSIILFALNVSQLDELSEPTFDPLFELESEIDYAFTPVIFETVFRNKRIDILLRQELLEFKKEIDDIPQELWEWEYLNTHQVWNKIRAKANLLLDKLEIIDRNYNK
ncbi:MULTISPECIES: hypothetical protein [Myroides]|nr:MULTISPECIES: hypothetical protein [Myroides]